MKVFDTDTGDLLTDNAVGPVGGHQSVTLDCEVDGFVWMELRDNDNFETTAIRVYGPEGLVSDLSHLNEDLVIIPAILTTDANGRPLYCGTRNSPAVTPPDAMYWTKPATW